MLHRPVLLSAGVSALAQIQKCCLVTSTGLGGVPVCGLSLSGPGAGDGHTVLRELLSVAVGQECRGAKARACPHAYGGPGLEGGGGGGGRRRGRLPALTGSQSGLFCASVHTASTLLSGRVGPTSSPRPCPSPERHPEPRRTHGQAL